LIGYDYRFAAICANTNDTTFTSIFSLPALPPHPNVFINPTASPITFCLGDSVKFDATSFSAAVYDWMKDSVELPGWKFSDFAATEPGTYMVRVSSALSPCPAYSNQIKLKTNDPGYTVSLTLPTDSIICAGNSVLLTAMSSKPGLSYQWRRNNVNIPGASSNTYLVTSGGAYSVLAFDGLSACPAISRSILFSVKPTPPATISVPGGTTTACEDVGVLLSAPKGLYRYQWRRAGAEVVGWNDSAQVIRNSGAYSVKVISADGCISVSSDIDVNIIPSPIPLITRAGFKLGTTTPYVSYTWIRNSTEEVGSGSILNVTKKGVYRVKVVDFNGCTGISTPIEMMDQELSISNNKLDNAVIKLYPNPTSGNIVVESPVPVYLCVKDFLGKTIINRTISKQLDLHAYPDGVYLLIISDADGNLIQQEKVTKISKQ
jgi:hypothetical protein